jgi:ribonuclease VapC
VNDVVLDASALLALLRKEPGWETVESVLPAMISAVNVSEVVAKLAEDNVPPVTIRQAIEALRLDIHPFDEDLAYAAGSLRPATRALGLSFGDRTCLALAHRLGATALTADRAWQHAGLGVALELIR